jgi:hypothetical protein
VEPSAFVPISSLTAHLAAISLQIGRSRDHDRIERFIEAGVLDTEKLEAILRRHGLLEKWRRFQ